MLSEDTCHPDICIAKYNSNGKTEDEKDERIRRETKVVTKQARQLSVAFTAKMRVLPAIINSATLKTLRGGISLDRNATHNDKAYECRQELYRYHQRAFFSLDFEMLVNVLVILPTNHSTSACPL